MNKQARQYNAQKQYQDAGSVFVAQELQANSQRSLYSWQEGKAEIEFIQDINGQVVPQRTYWPLKTDELHSDSECYKHKFF